MQTIQHPANGPFKMAAWPVRFSGSPPPVKPAPLLGEHTGDVLSHWLGLTTTQSAPATAAWSADPSALPGEGRTIAFRRQSGYRPSPGGRLEQPGDPKWQN